MNLKEKKWLWFAITAGLLWGIWGIIAKGISGDVSPFMNHILFTCGMIFTIPIVIRKCKWATLSKKGALWAIIAGTFAISGNVAVFYAFSLGGQAAIVIPLTNLYPLITIIVAVIFLKEKLNGWNIVGLLLAIPAILLLSGQHLLFENPRAFLSSINGESWLLYALCALICWGLFSLSQKIATNHISAEWSYAIFIFTSVIISMLFVLAGKWQTGLSQSNWVAGIIAGAVNGGGVLASFAAYREKGKASSVTTIAGTLQPVFTILLAMVLLNEIFGGKEFTGMLLAIAGGVLLSIENNTTKQN
jgi:drug/metabolite transporter (DMT)-like permease